jgi:GNAT superfamily N-acetyltransferase
MDIRPATIKDLKAIQELNLLLFKKEHREYDKLLDLNWTFGEVGTKYFKELIEEEDSCVFVAEDDGKIIGYLAGSETEAEDYRKLPKVAELDNMLVLKENRGSGIGRKLYDAFIEWCKSRDVKIVRIQATAQNKDAIEYYHKMGLKDYTLILEGKIQ